MLFAVIFSLAIALPMPVRQVAGAEGKEPNWDLINEQYKVLFARIFPLPDAEVAFLVYRDLYADVPEFACGMRENFRSHVVSADFVTVDGTPLRDQIELIHRQMPGAPLDVVESRIKVKRATITSTECPQLRRMFDSFNRLSLPMKTARDRRLARQGRQEIRLHPVVYSFNVWISGGGATFSLSGREHPFVRWATAAQAVLVTCGSTTRQRGRIQTYSGPPNSGVLQSARSGLQVKRC